MSVHAFVSLSPSSGQLTNLYTVPAAKRATLRVICSNRSADATAVKVSIAPGGAADDVSQYVIYNVPLPGNDSTATAPLMVAAGAVVRVSSSNGLVNFHCTGLVQDA